MDHFEHKGASDMHAVTRLLPFNVMPASLAVGIAYFHI